MSNSIWAGQEWALHTLPCAEEWVAVAALLEEEEEAEEKWEEEGVSGVRKYSSKNASMAASSSIIFSLSSFISVAKHLLHVSPWNRRLSLPVPQRAHLRCVHRCTDGGAHGKAGTERENDESNAFG